MNPTVDPLVGISQQSRRFRGRHTPLPRSDKSLAKLLYSHTHHAPDLGSFLTIPCSRDGVGTPHALRISFREVSLLASDLSPEYPLRAQRNGPTVWKQQLEGIGPPQCIWNGRNCLEQREQFRYGVRALVDFEWLDDGVLRRAQGLTRDISPKGMFIYSDSEPPTKSDLRVKVSFGSVAEGFTNVQLRANALVVRVEPSSIPGMQHGFAILNRSCQLDESVSSIEN
jgi:hypothetical protein